MLLKPFTGTINRFQSLRSRLRGLTNGHEVVDDEHHAHNATHGEDGELLASDKAHEDEESIGSKLLHSDTMVLMVSMIAMIALGKIYKG